MRKQISAGLALFGILTTSLAYPVGSMAQTPYWDNSANQNYYNPNSYGSGTQPYAQPQQVQPYTTTQPYGGNNSFAQPYPQSGFGQQPTYTQPTQLSGYVSTAPAGTSLFVTNTSYIASDTAHVGDPVNVTLGYDLAMGGNVLLPAGTQIQGQVVSAIPAGRAGKHGQLQMRFNRAVLPDGRQYPLSARLVTEDGTGTIKGGTTAERAGTVAKSTATGAAIGAVSGMALGRIVGGRNRWNEGLMWGSILGASGGLARSATVRGDEAEIQPGQQFKIMLDQNLNTNPGTPAGPGYPY